MYKSKKISFKTYINKFNFIIFPISLISIFIHEIQCWSIPFHFFLIKNIHEERNIKFNYLYLLFALLILASSIVFLYPVSNETINSMIGKLDYRDLWSGAMSVASSSEGNLNIIAHEIKTNLLNLYNFKINLFFLIMGTIPINLILYYFNKKKVIYIQNKKIYLYFYLSIIPYLAFFAIGDTGRWLHLISIVSFGFLGHYPLNSKNNLTTRSSFSIVKILLVISLIVYCFFIRLPHGGNLEEKKITIWGGLHKKFEAFYKIYFYKVNDEKFDLNKRFKKN